MEGSYNASLLFSLGNGMIRNAIVIEYDIHKYPFKRVLETQVYRIPDLAKMHRYWKLQKKVNSLDYQDNLRLRKLMQQLPDEVLFYQVYHRWVAQVIAPRFHQKISYTKHPKMRVHLAGTGAVSDFHRDAHITKRDEQINVYLPFTDVAGGATLWCESDYGNRQFEPLDLKYGQALLWDGGYLEHGTVENNTDHTRVSCDFRFHPLLPEQVEAPWKDILSGRPIDLEVTLQNRSPTY